MKVSLRKIPVVAAGLACVVSVSLTSGCSDGTRIPVPQSNRVSPTAVPSQTPSGSSGDTPPVRNDFAKLPLERSVGAGPLSVIIEYNTRRPVEDWAPDVSKPVRVSVTAVNKRKSSQKIYLTKVSADVAASDDSGPVDDPRTLTDTTNINPGFIVTSPNTYNQQFLIPASNSAANQVTIDFTFEFVLQVDKDKDGRNFSKQVATDSITVPLTG